MTTLSLFGETWEASNAEESTTHKKASRKSKQAYRTISEVAKDMGVASHVLRFWESKFPEIQPLRRGGGRRYYRPEDISILKNLQHFLHDEGYTIRGVQALVKREGSAILEQGDGLQNKAHKDFLKQASQGSQTLQDKSDVIEELYTIRTLLSEG